MTLKIYGIARSRAIRNIWMAHELGVPYEHIQTDFSETGCRAPAFRAINPNGRVPAIDDDGVLIWESLAINLYLARKHGGPIAPADLAEEGRTLSWSFWSVTDVEPHAATAMYNTSFYPPEQRDPALVTEALAALVAPLAVLEQALIDGGGYLVGNRFTVADLNAITCVFYLRFTPQALADLPHIRAWYEAGLARPAARAAFALRGE
jgi:glutathione S-transferase